MVSQKMLSLGTSPSVIRDMFEYGNKRKAEIGAQNVYDFSLGNPSVEPPEAVKKAAMELLNSDDALGLHSYTSASGDMNVKKAISDYINTSYGTSLTPDHIYMTCGAAASLTITLTSLAEDGDEFITFAPFFPEYRVFVEKTGAKLVVSECDREDFQPDIEDFEKSVTPHTKGVIINSPNNPSGVVITRDNLTAIADILRKKSLEYGHNIVLISDEPYRELVYGDVDVPYLMNLYDDTIVCYSFSKSLSLPGERIGYIAVSDSMDSAKDVVYAIAGAGRALGYVCAPSLFQRVVMKCLGQTSDVNIYKKNRDILTEALTEYGYRCIQPDGAFYLFVEALEEDAGAFSEKAKEYELLLVPSDSFGVEGFVRISYCVSTEQIRNSLPAFKKLAQSYK